MSDYIKMWMEIIEKMDYDNTYKFAWGRAILELVSELEEVTDINTINFELIAYKMLKYYWNQIFFFNLKQGPSKIPVIVQETHKCIDFYIEHEQSKNPVWFDYAENILKKDNVFYKARIRKIANTLKGDVSWRFKNCEGGTLELYTLSKENKEIYFSDQEIMDLKEYAFVLSQLLSYKWAQALEKFNSCPRIASKVKGISDAKLKRSNLRKFRDILLQQMKDGKIIDFYTGDILEEHEISIDHVIPWSIMYSDDIWNLVITSKKVNSKKNNTIPSEEVIEKLVRRNDDLVNALNNEKYCNDLKIAIENDYVHKFYSICKL